MSRFTRILRFQTDPRRSIQVSAIAGGLIWSIVCGIALTTPGRFGVADLLLMLAALVVVPLGIGLVATPNRLGQHPRSYRAAAALQPAAALLLVLSYGTSSGVPAALLALPWLACTSIIALFGLARFLPRGPVYIEEACIDVSLVYLLAGGVWVVLARAGFHSSTLSTTIVLLTAIHFHYAGFGATLIAGLVGRSLELTRRRARMLFRFSAGGILAGFPIVALGFGRWPAIGLLGAVVLGTSVVALSGLTFWAIIPSQRQPVVRVLLGISAAAPIAPMVLAGLYAWDQFSDNELVSIHRMADLHGVANSIGFVLCGLVAWTLIGAASRLSPPGIPFSRLRSHGRIGPDFFTRAGVIRSGVAAPSGLSDDFNEYRRADFASEQVHSAVRDFYEHTDRYELLVRPCWRRGFGLGARVFQLASKRVGQLQLPLRAETTSTRIDSRIVPLRDAADGRDRVRAWIRTYAETGEALYVAAYATHQYGDQHYMNIAFPLPGGNLTSILRLAMLPATSGREGIVLTTWPRAGQIGDEGVYFANGLLPVRLPFNETIAVWAASGGEPEAAPVPPAGTHVTVLARHTIWVFGVRFLTLDYAIFLQPNPTSASDHRWSAAVRLGEA